MCMQLLYVLHMHSCSSHKVMHSSSFNVWLLCNMHSWGTRLPKMQCRQNFPSEDLCWDIGSRARQSGLIPMQATWICSGLGIMQATWSWSSYIWVHKMQVRYNLFSNVMIVSDLLYMAGCCYCFGNKPLTVNCHFIADFSFDGLLALLVMQLLFTSTNAHSYTSQVLSCIANSPVWGLNMFLVSEQDTKQSQQISSQLNRILHCWN